MGAHHDRLFRRVFSRPDQAAGLFRSLLSADESLLLDWAALEPVPCDFFDERLQGKQTDLLFTTHLVDGRAPSAYPLVEHKSWRDPGVGRKVLAYACSVLERHAELNPGTGDAVVIPLLVYHGRRPWRPGKDRRRREAAGAAPPLARFQLWSRILFLDLQRMDEAAVRALPMPALGRLTLLYLQFLPGRRPSVIEACLRRWRDLLAEVYARDPGLVTGALSSYVLYATEMSEARLARLLRELIGTRAEERVMSTAEKLIQKGRKVGRTQGQADLLLRQLTRRFGPLSRRIEVRVRAGKAADLERWADAILTAKTIAAVFAS